MFKRKNLVFLLLGALSTVASAATAPLLQPGVDFSLEGQETPEITINNRILIKVNGKSISVLDVSKKMDLLFYRQFPAYATSPIARYQYYSANWRAILRSVIDDQLILADADEKKVEVTDGDVREELEELFGPDVVLNIDKIGLTYEEAWTLLKDELKVRQMNGMMVRSKAMHEVNPKAIRELYDTYVKSHPNDSFWTYRVLSIRGKDEDAVTQLAARTYQQLAEESPIEAVVNQLQKSCGEGINISLSEEYQRKDKELSLSHKAILQTLQAGTVSLPALQTDQKSKESIARLFLLNAYQKAAPSSFDVIKNQLQSELTQQAVERHAQAYIQKLRTHYGVTDDYVAERVPENLQPFALR